jgi:crossover junction endodeoxyribonuclease RuvC
MAGTRERKVYQGMRMEALTVRPSRKARTISFPICDRGADCIIGIDPGLGRTGYCVLHADARSGGLSIVEAGVIRLTAKRSLEQRLVDLEGSLAALLDSYTPSMLVCEQLYAHYKHPRTAILMAHARGVILAAAARRNIPIENIAATQAKRMLTGRGHASKEQMQRAVAIAFGLAHLPEPHDLADAIAIAYGGHEMRRRNGVAVAGAAKVAEPAT